MGHCFFYYFFNENHINRTGFKIQPDDKYSSAKTLQPKQSDPGAPSSDITKQIRQWFAAVWCGNPQSVQVRRLRRDFIARKTRFSCSKHKVKNRNSCTISSVRESFRVTVNITTPVILLVSLWPCGRTNGPIASDFDRFRRFRISSDSKYDYSN